MSENAADQPSYDPKNPPRDQRGRYLGRRRREAAAAAAAAAAGATAAEASDAPSADTVDAAAQPQAYQSEGIPSDTPAQTPPPAAPASPPTTPPQPPQGDPEEKKRRWWLWLLLLLLLLLLCCAGAYQFWWKDRDTDPAAGTPSPTPVVASPSVAASPTGAGAASPSAGAASPSAIGSATPSAPAPSPSPTAPSGTTIVVPDVVGETGSSAQQILTEAGFSTVTCKDSAGNVVTALDGYVVTAQRPAAGTSVPADTPIQLTCKPSSGGKG